MVLTSDDGWPYTLSVLNGAGNDFCVNSEVERAWQIVKGDLTEWFSTDGGPYFTPGRRVLIGTPGIGKSMAAGSYLLYQLLHCDVEKLQFDVYSVGGSTTYVCGKTIKTVTRHVGGGASMDVLWDCGIV
ncbi:retrotransposon hot spot (RHS) protein [Trypanosoma cruzi]|nr:retrotransposon hot spot (RHS) protein [Trypanosoma cruzi]